MSHQIPFNRPFLVGTELDRMREAMDGLTLSESGPFTQQCEQVLSEMLGGPAVLLTSSCTHALEMSAILLDVVLGDEVIVPSFTFVSTANAFALRGATPVFADIHPDTLNIDAESIAALITERTRAIVCVHYGGVACEMDAICRIAEEAGVPLVEDSAHALSGRYRGRALGTFGAVATQSFHETKNFTCGKGGGLVVNDLKLLERARIIREKGTDRDSFRAGRVDKYTWVDLGSSYLPPDILSAFLLCQLEARDLIQSKRRSLWNRYDQDLADWARGEGVRTPTVPAYAEQTHHLYYLILPTTEDRDRLLAHLRDRGIHAVFHYQPLHLSRMGCGFGGRPGDCPVTEEVSAQLVRLPFFTGMSASAQERVIRGVLEFRVT